MAWLSTKSSSAMGRGSNPDDVRCNSLTGPRLGPSSPQLTPCGSSGGSRRKPLFPEKNTVSICCSHAVGVRINIEQKRNFCQQQISFKAIRKLYMTSREPADVESAMSDVVLSKRWQTAVDRNSSFGTDQKCLWRELPLIRNCRRRFRRTRPWRIRPPASASRA